MQKQQQLYELDLNAKNYQITISHLSTISKLDDMEFDIENDEIFILSDDENIDTNDETSSNEDIEDNIYIKPLVSINDWRNMVSYWIEMIEDELQNYFEEFIVGEN